MKILFWTVFNFFGYLQRTRCPLTVMCLSLQIPTNASGLIEYRAHPFWHQKYCPSHEVDGTPRCCSCERMEVGLEYLISNGFSLELLANFHSPGIFYFKWIFLRIASKFASLIMHQSVILYSNVYVHGLLLSWFCYCPFIMMLLSPGEILTE